MSTDRTPARIRRACGFAAFVIAVAIASGRLAAQDDVGAAAGDADGGGGVTLTLTPTDIKLDAGMVTQTLVLTAQASDGTFKNAKLEIFTSPGISAKEVRLPDFARSGNLAAWTINVTAGSKAPASSTAVFRVDYELTGEVVGTAAAAATVAYQAPSLTSSIKASLNKGFGELESNKTHTAILGIENSGPVDVTMTGVTLAAPDTIELTAVALPVAIPAHGAATVPLNLTVPERVTPGEVTLLLSLALSSGAASETLIVTDKVAIGIPVLSDITTALQIPSLLFLPGLLIVLTGTMLWGLRSDGKLALTPANPEFYVLAVTLSILAALVFSWLVGQPFDFLRRVGVTDIARLWFGSIAAGCVGFGLAVLIDRGWRALKARQAKKEQVQNELVTPETTDEAREIIAKLGRHNRDLTLDRREIKRNGDVQIVFALGFGNAEAGKAWFVPKIIVKSSQTDGKLNAKFDDLRNQDKAKELAEYLAGEGKALDVDWAPAKIVTAPAILSDGDGTPKEKQKLIDRG